MLRVRFAHGLEPNNQTRDNGNACERSGGILTSSEPYQPGGAGKKFSKVT
jgi:hypothetical protein